MTEPDPFLHSAASYLRTVPEPGWDAISDRVRAAVHAASRVGWPIRASRDAGAGVVYITDHALRSLLARELRSQLRLPADPNRFYPGRRRTACHRHRRHWKHGTQLRDLGDDIRRLVLDTIRTILDDLDQDGSSPAGPIDVTITTLWEGDPLG